MKYRVTILPQKLNLDISAGTNLLQLLQELGIAPEAPCGGAGQCGKCRVLVDGEEATACRTIITRDMVVTIPQERDRRILTDGIAIREMSSPGRAGYLLAFDIGTTTVVGYLLDGSGGELAAESRSNPQGAFGADVISRIRHALEGQLTELTGMIRACVEEIACCLCEKTGVNPGQISRVSMVGNPAMQQIYLGISPDNLARIPFAPVLTRGQRVRADAYLPLCPHADFLIVPDVAGFVGADTLACILATDMHRQQELTLLVDIGTNGEMVLGNRDRMVACAAAAGPALEGANIRFGMGARPGAIDHVWLERGKICCSTINHKKATGICGSGLIDAVAAGLNGDLINGRGRILDESRRICLTEEIYLTQEDIRQVQMAKGAIGTGIRMMAEHLGVALEDIGSVYLAGAFGTYMCPESACRIGLLPPELEGKIRAVGNAAGSGAKLLAANPQAMEAAQTLVGRIEFLELSLLPGFSRCFAADMRFDDPQTYWLRKALGMGFSEAAPLELTTLKPRQDVRAMCSDDKCRAYGKNWTCPPHCGTLTDCEKMLGRYRRGILLQTVGVLEKTIDTRGYRRTEDRHLELFYRFAEQIRSCYPDALCLGAGGCRICEKCAFPQPCRFPEKACPSMEGYGLFVTQVCRDNGLAYHHGARTVTYTACVLF